jgi:hypothetical protein
LLIHYTPSLIDLVPSQDSISDMSLHKLSKAKQAARTRQRTSPTFVRPKKKTNTGDTRNDGDSQPNPKGLYGEAGRHLHTDAR